MLLSSSFHSCAGWLQPLCARGKPCWEFQQSRWELCCQASAFLTKREFLCRKCSLQKMGILIRVLAPNASPFLLLLLLLGEKEEDAWVFSSSPSLLI